MSIQFHVSPLSYLILHGQEGNLSVTYSKLELHDENKNPLPYQESFPIVPPEMLTFDCKCFGILQVCLGDRIIVDIINNMPGRGISIHWHGIFQQGSQFMDGVPMVTQCSIHESDIFRYDFYANNEGTHFYHSHDGNYTLLKLTKLIGLTSTYFKGKSIKADASPNHLLFRIVRKKKAFVVITLMFFNFALE